MIYTQTRIHPRERDALNFLGILDTDHLIPARRPNTKLIIKKENLPSIRFCQPLNKNKRKRKD